MVAFTGGRFAENGSEAFPGMDNVAFEEYAAFEFPVFRGLFPMLLKAQRVGPAEINERAFRKAEDWTSAYSSTEDRSHTPWLVNLSHSLSKAA